MLSLYGYNTGGIDLKHFIALGKKAFVYIIVVFVVSISVAFYMGNHSS